MSQYPPVPPGNEQAPQYPGPYPPQQPPQPNNTLKIVAIILGALGLLCIGGVALMYFATRTVFDKAKLSAQKVASMSNLKQIGISMTLYNADYDEYQPPAASWSTALEPYLNNTDLYRLPTNTNLALPGEFYYAFSTVLGGKSTMMVENMSETVLLFESSSRSQNAHGGSELLPRPPFFGDYTQFCMADTSARSLTSAEISLIDTVGDWPHFGQPAQSPAGNDIIR